MADLRYWEEAKELAADALIELWKHWSSLRYDERALRAYVFTTARRKLLHGAPRQRRQRQQTVPLGWGTDDMDVVPALVDPASHDDSPAAVDQRMVRVLHAALGKLEHVNALELQVDVVRDLPEDDERLLMLVTLAVRHGHFAPSPDTDHPLIRCVGHPEITGNQPFLKRVQPASRLLVAGASGSSEICLYHCTPLSTSCEVRLWAGGKVGRTE